MSDKVLSPLPKPVFHYRLNEEEERKMILKKYRQLVAALKTNFRSREEQKWLKNAFKLAAEAHKHMRRKNGDPYILHPIAVAQIVIEEIGLETQAAIAALLHDTVEDSSVTLSDIEEQFGAEIRHIVSGLTKMPTFANPHISTQAYNIKKILLGIVQDPKVILIKLADRLHNMRTMQEMKPEKRIEISGETMHIYVPIAHRLGLFRIKTELETLCMMYLEPLAYQKLSALLKETQSERTRLINSFIGKVKKLIGEYFPALSYQVNGRTKSVYSIWSKMQRKNIPFNEVFDVFAIRIVLDVSPAEEKEVCWTIFSLISRHFFTLKDRVRDWIIQPKSNGYSALHTTVLDKNGKWIEVQIRSRRMNEIAEKGLAAHFNYKENNTELTPYDTWFLKLREILEAKDNGNLQALLEDFKHSLVVENIFIFTPKGEVKQLPINASVLDFAYSIHTNIGMHCIGARVNNRAVSADTTLQSGDNVEIITSQKQKPSKDQLPFLVSSKARKIVQHYLKTQERLAIKKGMRLFLSHLETQGIQRKKNFKKFILQKFSCQHIDEFYLKIQDGRIALSLIDKSFFNHKSSSTINLEDPVTSKDKTYTIAPCCQPVAGESICGIINRNISENTITIHTIGCTEASHIISTYDCTVIAMNWDKNQQISFPVQLLVSGVEKKGLVYEVSKLLYVDLGLELHSFIVQKSDENKSDNNTFMLYLKISVANKASLSKAIEGIKKIEGVVSAKRFIGAPPFKIISDKDITS